MKEHPIVYLAAVLTVLLLVGVSCGNGEAPAEPGPGSVESFGVQSTAEVGDATVSEYNRARIYFLALDGDNAGIGDLAPAGHTGDQTSIIALPAGWTLHTAEAAPGGCVLEPTHIYNPGNGRYKISLVTSSTDAPCPWGEGEYVYHLMIDTAGFQGATIGKIAIQ